MEAEKLKSLVSTRAIAQWNREVVAHMKTLEFDIPEESINIPDILDYALHDDLREWGKYENDVSAFKADIFLEWLEKQIATQQKSQGSLQH